MAIRLLGFNNRKLELRKRSLTDNEDGGNYHLLEIAYIEDIDSDEYIRSVGVAGRYDQVSDDVRALQKAEDIQRKNKREARDLAEADVVKSTT